MSGAGYMPQSGATNITVNYSAFNGIYFLESSKAIIIFT